MAKLKVGIIGGSGYGGGELLRILLFHPRVDLRLVTAHQQAGRRVDEVHPNLRHLTDLRFAETTISEEFDELDCLFLALPHGESMTLVPELPDGVKLIDLAGDYRLQDAETFARYYGRPHASFHLQSQFVYGLPELNRERIGRAQRVANPGCFATAALLGTAPLIARGLIEGTVIVDAKTGSSGSGAKPTMNTHHPRRANSFFAYKAFSHQHRPEIVQTLRAVNPEWSERLILQTHSAPMVRGIFATIYGRLGRRLVWEDLRDLFQEFYADCFFVRLVEGSPDVNWVKQTNFADIGWAVDGQDVIVFVAIDNLVKGAAGQAVQNMNLMFGLEEQMGLVFPGSHP
ncbi:MAG: N-acetyl-gamma-glutamyl-phosphate reductase [Acidobacteria bacterium]|nr:MAG: N-acetyl-gamma-glutamyl-phosphate reductase [Acidobacteriota bacterium]